MEGGGRVESGTETERICFGASRKMEKTFNMSFPLRAAGTGSTSPGHLASPGRTSVVTDCEQSRFIDIAVTVRKVVNVGA